MPQEEVVIIEKETVIVEKAGEVIEKDVVIEGEVLVIEQGSDNAGHPPDNAIVEIVVDGVARKIRSGPETVAAIKEVGKVPLADDLDQVVNGKLVPLPDNGSVVIKGGEVFLSHPKDSGSSSH